MKYKRVLAYCIDMIIVMFISSFIFSLPFFENDYNNYLELSDKLTSSFNDDEMTNGELINLEYDLNKAGSNLFIIKLGVTFFYFGILGFLFNGRTLGKRIFRLRIIPMGTVDLRPGLFILRAIIVDNILFDGISVLSLILGSKGVWLLVNGLVSFLSYILSFILLIFMFVRDDGRSLHDLLCRSAVILEK
jgi:uncharacterized RDD family membrane protein YckC